jgi:hypothetical protein
LEKPANLSLSVAKLIKKVYEEKKRIKEVEKDNKENNSGEDNLEDIEAINNINPYSILVSTKGDLAFIVSNINIDKKKDKRSKHGVNWDRDGDVDVDDEENDDENECNENNYLGGFEKIRYDAPEIKMGLYILLF